MILSWRHLSLSDGFCLSYRWAHFKKGLCFFIIRYDVGGRLFRLLPTHSFSDYKCTKKIVGNNLLINKSGFGKLKVFLCFWLSVLCEKFDDRNQWTICETEFREKCAFILLVCRRKIELCFCAILLPFVCCPLSSYSWLFFK